MLRFVGIFLWSVAYFYAFNDFIYKKWSVSIFKLGQWKMMFTKWRDGEWLIDTPNEYALMTVLALLVPVWLIGIFFVCRLTRDKKQSIVRQATASHPFIPAYTPMHMPSQGKSAQLDSATVFQQTQEAYQPQPVVTDTENQMPQQSTVSTTRMDYVPKHQGEAQALEKISDLAQEFGLTAFPHVLLENQLIPVTVSNDSDALLIKVLADPTMWQVPMTEPLENGAWMNNGVSKSVLKEIVLGKNILLKMEPDSVVVPVVVLAQGTLSNSDAVLPWLNQHGVEVVTLADNPQSGIATLDDIIIKYFPEEENQEEENEAHQEPTV